MSLKERLRLSGLKDNSGLNPEIRTIYKGDWIKNAQRTSDEHAAVGGSWKEYWQIFTLQDFPTKCPFCGETLEEEDINGCHIKVSGPIIGKTAKTWSRKIYIIPGHHKCNMKLDAEFQAKINITAAEAIEKK